MEMRPYKRPRQGFTLVELLTVIAIIAILAALLLPVFAAVREQSRQSGTLSNMQAVYVGARLFYEDEGHFPSTLFPYAEAAATPPATPNPSCPANRPAVPADVTGGSHVAVPMDEATGFFTENANCSQLNRGYLYREQVKDYNAFLCPDNLVKDKTMVTQVYYPLTVFPTPTLVTWQAGDPTDPTKSGDADLPYDSSVSYTSPRQPKLYYRMDSMDIGPMLNSDGTQRMINGVPAYELHYTPDWTHELGATADVNGSGQANVTQLKYRNPPANRTIITYVTDHVTTAKSSSVLILLDSGTARKMDYQAALQQLPLNYQP